MSSIRKHPILPIPEEDKIAFLFEGQTIFGQRGFTIAAALHQAGLLVHKHSLDHRNRSLSCGIGKCGACEMLVDGKVRRICITKVDGVKEVQRIPDGFLAEGGTIPPSHTIKVYKTIVAIIGAGPAGLAVREELDKKGIPNLVIDNNVRIGGQFNMQTHQFFFFEKEKRFGGMRGFEIAASLAGENHEGILLNSTVWDIFDNKRLAVKNIETQEIFYVDAEYLVIATGSVPFMPPFGNDDVPGVYTAAVFQRMMNSELTLLGKNILTVGAGNIGYLTSYQAMQAGARVRAIIEAMPHEGGFPVQANRVRRLGIPIITSHMLLEAIPNKDYTGISGAVIASCRDFKVIPGTEKILKGIDTINICTGLLPDDQLLLKGRQAYGLNCHGVGDAIRIGEGTSAVLRGKQCAYEIMQQMGVHIPYDDYLAVSKEYIDSQQHPVRILDKPALPSGERMRAKPFVLFDCLYGFACNPCTFACKYGAIRKDTTSSVPVVDYDKCIGCMACVSQCPGLAIFGFDLERNTLFLPVEYEVTAGAAVYLVDNQGRKKAEGTLEKIMTRPNKTHVARVRVHEPVPADLLEISGFIVKEEYPEEPDLHPAGARKKIKTYICHCEDVTLEDLLKLIGDRDSITADELKHISRMGMGACRGSRCLPRAVQILRSHGIQVISGLTPRGPMANLVQMGELYPSGGQQEIILPKVINKEKDFEEAGVIIAGGGIAGSALFRYLAEEGFSPVLVNHDRGSSWRNIAGGRPAFSLPALADISAQNLGIFKELDKKGNIDFHISRYVNFVHDQATFRSLEASMAWSDAHMVEARDFHKEISPAFNPYQKTYSHALITNNCWQASPGKTLDLIRHLGTEAGGRILEQTRIVDVEKQGDTYTVILLDHRNRYQVFRTRLFINALGQNGEEFARKLGYITGVYPVRHQAFITKRLPMLGKDGKALDMLIDRRNYKGFSAVYGQQLADTGQIIGCASPVSDMQESGKNLKVNTEDFLNIVSEVFIQWLPCLADAGFQAFWGGYYIEPRYIVDPGRGLFLGMRGHGFMLSQYLAKLYVDVLRGRKVPDYFRDLSLDGPGLSEMAFK
ncbi:MAG TPA: FAD-dependent oxidoreductase [Bacteroidales bacterium]|jgi:glycine/D-amino acid oxidase-like deaminating enzyme/thioredoxin reductase/Fe-S-cluster-containing hydrogenase component 2|nr:FAD-dependent oxidoreductase [Bacteroidales bacterium]MBP8998704.1 FAD-dependent oxidoreductase [Bacteroidales bacterium]NLZ08814.1 FAD-dependent oxidoreductase [Bacteroidales bacterium]HNZ45936.1 FAD-dependent oxidoreductase [Bacteroidales bacterium]HOG32314.1 FAD-dependent oxidoreductase [Bacteroidales bacterium]